MTSGLLPIVVLVVVLGILIFVYWRYRHSTAPSTAAPVLNQIPHR